MMDVIERTAQLRRAEMVTVFLDIDGVVATTQAQADVRTDYYGERIYVSPESYGYQIPKDSPLPKLHTSLDNWPFDRKCVSNLHQLQRDYNVKWVISSTWRIGTNPVELKNLFNLKGLYLAGDIAFTPGGGGIRGWQIKDYLDTNPCKHILIIDDNTHDILPTFSEEYVVTTEFIWGFNSTKLIEAMSKLDTMLGVNNAD